MIIASFKAHRGSSTGHTPVSLKSVIIGVKMMEIKAAIDCTGHADLANAVLTCGAQVVFD